MKNLWCNLGVFSVGRKAYGDFVILFNRLDEHVDNYMRILHGRISQGLFQMFRKIISWLHQVISSVSFRQLYSSSSRSFKFFFTWTSYYFCAITLQGSDNEPWRKQITNESEKFHHLALRAPAISTVKTSVPSVFKIGFYQLWYSLYNGNSMILCGTLRHALLRQFYGAYHRSLRTLV